MFVNVLGGGGGGRGEVGRGRGRGGTGCLWKCFCAIRRRK